MFYSCAIAYFMNLSPIISTGGFCTKKKLHHCQFKSKNQNKNVLMAISRWVYITIKQPLPCQKVTESNFSFISPALLTHRCFHRHSYQYDLCLSSVIADKWHIWQMLAMTDDRSLKVLLVLWASKHTLIPQKHADPWTCLCLIMNYTRAAPRW